MKSELVEGSRSRIIDLLVCRPGQTPGGLTAVAAEDGFRMVGERAVRVS